MMFVHEGRKLCISCKTTFPDSESFKQHFETHSHEKFICEFCGKHLKNHRTLKRHEKEIHENSEAGYDCKYCKKSYRRKDEVERHIRKMHKDSPLETDLSNE